MIGPKRPKLTRAQEMDAYELATLRDRGHCQMPGLHMGGIHRDHRQNRDAHNTVVENLQLLCTLHHKWKTEHPTEANAEGWGCPSYEDPAAWPARRLGGNGHLEWVLYLPVDQYEGEHAGAGWRVIDEIEAAARRAGLTAERVI